ncbi:DUF6412 domain-containing protein [Micromonospora sp. LOL_023]|uniref:DUF6412 domain-containing protein n=1 Tax=Micromonospora sp. LOL_023 TaxID=3345418 RepID=UPI003A88934A
MLLSVVTGIWAYAHCLIALTSVPPAQLFAAAAASVALLVATALAIRITAGRHVTDVDPAQAHRAGPRRARWRGIPRQLDPDAPGRPRPRAPGRSVVTA